MAELSAQAPLPRTKGFGRAGKGLRHRQPKGEVQQATVAGLDLLRVLGWLVQHDVALPGDAGIIDHLLAGPSGVYVVNTVSWSGAIKTTDRTLTVGGVDHADALADVAAAAEAVRSVLHGVPVAPMLCFERLEPVAGVAADVALCASENILDLLTSQAAILDHPRVAQASRMIGVTCRAGARTADVADDPAEHTEDDQLQDRAGTSHDKDATETRVATIVSPRESPESPASNEDVPASIAEELEERPVASAPPPSAEEVARMAVFARLIGTPLDDADEPPLLEDSALTDPGASYTAIHDAGAALWRELTDEPVAGRLAEIAPAEPDDVVAGEVVADHTDLAETEPAETDLAEAELADIELIEPWELVDAPGVAVSKALVLVRPEPVDAEPVTGSVGTSENEVEEAEAPEHADIAAADDSDDAEAADLRAREADEERELEAVARAAREARERRAREALEQVQQEARRLAEQEAQELAEREARRQAEVDAQHRAEREAAEREVAEREAAEREAAELEARAAAELLAAEREAAEREAREAAERVLAEAQAQAEAEARAWVEAEARLVADREARKQAALAEEGTERAAWEARTRVADVLDARQGATIDEQDADLDEMTGEETADEAADAEGFPTDDDEVQARADRVAAIREREARRARERAEREAQEAQERRRSVDVDTVRPLAPPLTSPAMPTTNPGVPARPLVSTGPARTSHLKPRLGKTGLEEDGHHGVPMRALVHVALAALVIAGVIVGAPRIPDAVSWAHGLFAEPPAPQVGTAVTVNATSSHPKVTVLAGRPVDAHAIGSFHPAKGQHLVAVPLRLTNEGPLVRWDVRVAARTTVVDSIGATHAVAKGIPGVEGLPNFPGQAKIVPGEVVTGYVVFSVPKGRELSSVNLRLSRSAGDAVTWQVTP